MEPGVIDLNKMPTEDLADLVSAAQSELAGRQTQDAIVRDVTGAVDPIIRENKDLLGGSWVSGRVSWDGHCMTVESPPEEPTAPAVVSATVEPAVWESGATIKAGARVVHGGRTFEVAVSHVASTDRQPGDSPVLYKEV